MIRREEQTPGGMQWVLIGQPDHAQLAAELARHWGAAPLEPRDELLLAIGHHDDGWTEWERSPQLDSERGRPLNFTEMPAEDSLEVWRRSIERAAARGPLVGWLVASHFSALLRGSSHAQLDAAVAWLTEFDARRRGWLAAWQESSPSASPEAAERALRHLQMFDWLSLWFCTAVRTKPEPFATPSGDKLTITPEREGIFLASPWPLHVESLVLEIAGRAIPADDYRGRWPDPLARAPRRQYRWVLRPQ